MIIMIIMIIIIIIPPYVFLDTVVRVLSENLWESRRYFRRMLAVPRSAAF